MKLLFGLILVVCVTVTTSVAYATTYRYVDANGATSYADGLENVPEQYRSRVVVVVSGKHATPITKNKENVSDSVQKTSKKDFAFRLNWLVLLCLLAAGILIAQRVKQSGRLEQGFRIKVAAVMIVLLLFIPFNLDLVRSASGVLQAKKQRIQAEIKEQEDRDKKPLKTLSEKVDEMMQQVQK